MATAYGFPVSSCILYRCFPNAHTSASYISALPTPRRLADASTDNRHTEPTVIKIHRYEYQKLSAEYTKSKWGTLCFNVNLPHYTYVILSYSTCVAGNVGFQFRCANSHTAAADNPCAWKLGNKHTSVGLVHPHCCNIASIRTNITVYRKRWLRESCHYYGHNRFQQNARCVNCLL